MKKSSIISLLILVFAMQAFAAAGKKEIKLRITEAATYVFDETSVFLDLGSSPFVYPEDGQKVFDTSSSACMLYSFSSNQIACFSNSYGNLMPSTVVPLGIKVSGNGTYIINATLLDNFDDASIIRLEDKTMGVFHDLRQGAYIITVNQPRQENDRFFLHVSTPPAITITPSGCNNDDGIITVDQDTSIRWTSGTLYDDSYNLKASFQNVTGSFSVGGLSFGNYNLVLSLASYSTIKPVYLSGNSVTVQVSASTTHTSVGQPVQFFANATNTSNYLWDFGDGSQITGIVNPTFSYIQPGVYQVTVYCSNAFGCVYTQYITIVVDEATSVAPVAEERISVIPQNKNLQVLISKPIESSYNLQLFNSVGQQLVSAPLTSGENTIDLNSLASGVYIARISNEQGGFSKKIVLQ